MVLTKMVVDEGHLELDQLFEDELVDGEAHEGRVKVLWRKDLFYDVREKTKRRCLIVNVDQDPAADVVETLNVTDLLVVDTESHQDPAQLFDRLRKVESEVIRKGPQQVLLE